jgi:hypothetical protein
MLFYGDLDGLLPGWAWHGLKSVGVFGVPLGALWFWRTQGQISRAMVEFNEALRRNP